MFVPIPQSYDVHIWFTVDRGSGGSSGSKSAKVTKVAKVSRKLSHTDKKLSTKESQNADIMVNAPRY